MVLSGGLYMIAGRLCSPGGANGDIPSKRIITGFPLHRYKMGDPGGNQVWDSDSPRLTFSIALYQCGILAKFVHFLVDSWCVSHFSCFVTKYPMKAT